MQLQLSSSSLLSPAGVGRLPVGLGQISFYNIDGSNKLDRYINTEIYVFVVKRSNFLTVVAIKGEIDTWRLLFQS